MGKKEKIGATIVGVAYLRIGIVGWEKEEVEEVKDGIYLLGKDSSFDSAMPNSMFNFST
ncbi:MAG: hypothetical protein WBA93_32620 [Microcoleaceae cyanobacterium]